MADMKVEVELVVLDSIRPVEFKRDFDDRMPQRLQMSDHDLESFADLCVWFKFGRRPLIDTESIDISVRVRALHQQKTHVDTR